MKRRVRRTPGNPAVCNVFELMKCGLDETLKTCVCVVCRRLLMWLVGV